VDDKTVDTYGTRLKELNQAIESSVGGQQKRVQFQSLVDLFNLMSYADSSLPSGVKAFKIPALHHDLATTLDDVAETCRRILVAGCQPSRELLRAQINSGDNSTLALYRGFSRFMLEDLDRHPLTDSLSRSRRKKLAAKVSFEMILRNQAYSNLIELMFPDHLRLSIHAHSNSGPKFGIRLFDTATVRAVRELDPVADGYRDDAMSASHLLHIPTPWHNCVAQVAGDPTLYIVKYGAVKEALFLHRYNFDIVKGSLAKGEGAFVSLKRSL
jgi:pyoverdine/dityrosine biosynthesis protein Dit1